MKTAKQSASADPVISDGILRFGVKPVNGTDADIVQHEVDILLLKLTCEACEMAHGLKETKSADGTYKVVATPAFLIDLAKRLQDIGLKGCSATVACQLWQQSSAIISDLKKNTSEPPSSPSGSTSRPKEKGRKGK